MFDFGGKFIIPIKMRKFHSFHTTIDYVIIIIIIPEIFTEYITEKQGVGMAYYKHTASHYAF